MNKLVVSDKAAFLDYSCFSKPTPTLDKDSVIDVDDDVVDR